MLVYVNLTIAFDHPEFVNTYHETRNKMLETFGKEVCEEIERIVSLKYKKILQNIEETRNFKNKKEELFIKIKNNSILNEDINYGLEYWQKFVKQTKRQK